MAEPGVPSWHADPSGRHEWRWWDGAGFTDQVADAGLVSTDPGPMAPPLPQPVPPAPPGGAPGRRAGWPVVVALVAVVVVAAVAWFVFLRDEGRGTGSFSGEASPDRLGVHEVSVGAGSALAVRVAPGTDLDAVVALVVSDDDADRLEDLYGDLDLVAPQSVDDAFDAVDGDQLDRLGDGTAVFRTDIGFAGDDEELLLAVPFALDVQVVVAPFADDDDDRYAIDIETFAIDTDADDDGEEVLDAVIDGEGIPSRVRRLAEDLLASVD